MTPLGQGRPVGGPLQGPHDPTPDFWGGWKAVKPDSGAGVRSRASTPAAPIVTHSENFPSVSVSWINPSNCSTVACEVCEGARIDDSSLTYTMSFDDDIQLARFKLVTDRQRYFTDLAVSTWDRYLKLYTGIIAGAITLISARSTLGITTRVLLPVLAYVKWLLLFLGLVTIVQITVCLVRWYGFRKAEKEINRDSPEIKRWWWVFEALFVFGVVVSLIIVWAMTPHVELALQIVSSSESLQSVPATPGF